MDTKIYAIILEQDEDGVFIITCPKFTSCYSHGKTEKEAISNISEAILLCQEEQDEEESHRKINKYLGIKEIELPTANV